MRARLALALAAVALPSCGDAALVNPAPTTEAAPAPAVPASIALGGGAATVVVETAPLRLRFLNARREVVLESLAGDADPSGAETHPFGALGATHRETELRTTLVEGWDHEISTDDPFWFGTTAVAATVTATSASLDLARAPGGAAALRLEIEVDGGDVHLAARVLAPRADRPENELTAGFVLPPDEHFFGLGERYLAVDHRGKQYTSWTEEGGIAMGEDAPPGPYNPGPNGPGMTHAPVPFYLSSKGYGLFVDTTYRVAYDLGATTPGAFRFAAMAPEVRWHVFVRDDPRESLRAFTGIVGRARRQAPWVYGPRHRYDHGDVVDGVPEYLAFRQRGIAMTMLDDTTHFLPKGIDAKGLAERAAWTTTIHDLGYRAIGYYNAYVSTTSDNAKDLVAHGRAHDLFVRLAPEEGESVGKEFETFMMSGGGQQVLTIDFTKPEAVAWYRSLLGLALDAGYDGWMLDFGEYLPTAALLHDGRTGFEAHNAFPLLYQKATTDYLEEVRGDDFMYFARAGWAGTQALAPVTWSGDPAGSFDDAKGLPAQVRAGINAGLSGIAVWGSDIGGYACNADPPPDKDVYLRWVELGALSPDMHDENACAEKPAGSPDKWWIWSDAETTEVFARYTKLHTRLFPYTYAAVDEATKSGLPIMRHPFLVNPEEPAALASEFEYWFGPSLFVAPVVERAATRREAWLPPGTWFDFWTMAPVAGGAKVTREAPLDVIPLWLRSGGIVPMLDPSIDTLVARAGAGVVGLDDVAGVLDVRAGIDRAAVRGELVLVDGTTLSVGLFGDAKLALPEGLAPAKDEADLASCDGCGRLDDLPGGAKRVRITTAPSAESSISAGPLLLGARRMPVATRVRWDVAVVP